MSTTLKISALAIALAAAFPAAAQSNAEILKELQDLKAKVADLENKLNAANSAAKPAGAQWGMTPDQVKDLNRVAVKTEALEDAVEAQGLKMLKISGFMDPTYLINQRQHRAGFQFMSPIALDPYSYDASYFGGTYLDLTKEMEGGTRWRLTLIPNRGAGSVIGDASIVQEASVSIPLGDLQTRFLAGQMPDWSGYEFQQATLNKLITHNLLYDFTLPTLYTGAGLEYIRGKWDVKWMLNNMNTSKRGQKETAPALAYRVDYSKGEFNGFGFAGVHGKAANLSANITEPGKALDPVTGAVIDAPTPVAQRDSRVDLFEADAYFIRGDFTWQGQLSYGRQRNASITPAADGSLRDASWYGLSTLLAYKFIPRWEVVGRFDYLNNSKNGGGLLGYTAADDRNGIGPGMRLNEAGDAWEAIDPNKGSNRMALSLGLSYMLNMNTTLKTEYRMDRANQPVFLDVRSGEYRKSNNVFGTSVVVSF